MANPFGPSWSSDNDLSSDESAPSSSDPLLSASAAALPSQQRLQWAAASRESFNRAVDAAVGAEWASPSSNWLTEGSPSVQNVPFSATGVASFPMEDMGSPSAQNRPFFAMGAGSLSKKDVGSPSVQDVPFMAMGAVSYPMEGASSQSMPFVPRSSGAFPKEEAESPSEVPNMPFGPMGSGYVKEDVGMAAGEAALSATGPPPFLTKTYDMVEDPSCNSIVSWGPANNSFIVWTLMPSPVNFFPASSSTTTSLASSDSSTPIGLNRSGPEAFLHHQMLIQMVETSCADLDCPNMGLIMQGFRKVDPNRWEFANEGFLRGQKHLLKGIQRRKPVSTSHPQLLLGPCLEVGKFGGAEGEIEGLRRDKNLLMSEVVRLRQQQQSTQQEISVLSQRLQTTEQKQQQLMTFLAKAMQNPSFMAQLMQKNEQAKCLDTTRKRRLPSVGSSNMQDTASSEVPEDGQVPDYVASPSNVNEELEALLQAMEQNLFSRKGAGEAIAAGQGGCDVHTAQQHVKLETPDGLEDLSGTSTLHKARSFTHDDSDEFWEQLLHAQNQMVAITTKRGMPVAEQNSSDGEAVAATLGTVPESSELWESKPDIDVITKGMGHLGSSPRG